jgi:multidrug resistance efflux pump
MTDTAQRSEAPARPVAPGTNGAGLPGETPAAAPVAVPRRFGRAQRLLLVALAVVAVVAGGLAGYRFWYDSSHYVTTNNAQVAGRLTQVGGLTAGRVAAVRYDVGDRVSRDAVVAVLNVPVPVGVTSSGAPRLEFRETSDSMVEVRSPVSGVVIARSASPGDTVPAGQTLLTIVDPEQLWITANIEETQIRRVRIGQPVTVTIDALAVDLEGRVAAITPASAATFSLLPSQNLSGNYTRVTQLVPVRIVLEQPDPRLMIGTSVTVRIRVSGE